jgi:NAD(P)H dehydrogenase (quinone)
MNALIVLAHPERRSFNGDMADVALETLREGGHDACLSDLYANGFDPVEHARHYPTRTRTDRFDVQAEQRAASGGTGLPADVLRELDMLERADLLILQFPMWWFSVPAILKGWIDRVLVYGRTYTSAQRYDRGHLRGRRAMLSVTLGGPESTFAHNGRSGDIDLLLWPMNMTLHYVGYTVLPPVTSFGIYEDGAEGMRRAERSKDAYRRRLADIDATPPLKFATWGDWDEAGRLRPGVPGHSLFMRAEP